MNFMKEMKENQPHRNHVLSSGHQRGRLRPLRPRVVVATASTVLATGWMVSPFGGLTALASTTLPSTDAPPVGSNGFVQVSTAAELEYMDQNLSTYASKNIELMNNIDLSGYSWVPFSNGNAAYWGTVFNGNGYTVSNFNVNSSALYTGFFGVTDGTIENLNIQGSVTSTGPQTGGLVGYQYGGLITNCSASVSVTGNGVTGGLVGNQQGNITSSYATGSVNDASAFANTGGLVGAEGNTSTTSSISNSYATGFVNGAGATGGLVGKEYQGSSISNSYETGSVNSSQQTSGGLVGLQDGSITNSYATGVMSSTIGGGLAYTSTGGVPSNSFFDTTTTGKTTYDYGSVATGAESNNQMQVQSTFSNAGWDFTSTWAIAPNKNGGYPYLQSLGPAADASTLSASLGVADGGTGGTTTVSATANTAGDTLYYLVSTSQQAIPLQGFGAYSTITQAPTSGTNLPAVANDYVGVYEVNSSNQIVAFSQIQLGSGDIATDAPTLGTTPTAAPGSSVGTTTVTATANTSGDKLVYQVSTSAIATPLPNSAPPSGSGVFASGTNLSAAAGDTVGVYEVNSSKQVVAFSSLTLTRGDIATDAPTLGTTPTAAPGSSVGTTTVAATSNTSGDTLVYQVSTSTITAPLLNSAQPSGSNVFTSSTNLSAAAGDTVGVYEVNSSKQVVAFSSLTLTRGDIATSPGTTPPVGSNGFVQVSTAAELEYMDQNLSTYASKNIELMNNIDLSGYSWVPFTNGNTTYSGTFNGNGYTVSNLNVNSSALYTGFFGVTDGTIENLNIQGSVTSTGPQTGGLVGYQYGGLITNCSASVSVTGNGVTGGLVGNQQGNIISSYATGSVYDASAFANTGGLVGAEGNTSTTSSISNSYATGFVNGAASTGGLVGKEYSGSSISNSYETGSVSSSQQTSGGLVGLQYGSITNSYATGVMSSTIGGGLVYASKGGVPVPGNSFFDTTTTGQTTYDGSVATGAELNTQMQVQSTFNNAGWDFTSTWAIAPNKNGGYPYLQSLGPAADAPTLSASLGVAAGGTVGTTTVSATANTAGDTLYYLVSTSQQAIPLQGFGAYSTITQAPTSGANLPAVANDYVGVYEVNSSNQIVAFSQIQLGSGDIATDAPTLGTTPTAAPGSSVGTTTVTATANTSGDKLVYQVSTSTIAVPLLNSAPPSESNVFTSGTNLSAAAGDTVGVYELNSSHKVVAFSSITLTSGELRPSHYTVTFNSNGGSGVSSESVAYNGTAPQPTNPTKTGYTFAGWYSDKGLTTPYSFGTAVTGNVALYAKWTINDYTVTFNSNGGSNVSSESVVYNSTASQPSKPTKTGYTFASWFSDKGLKTPYSFSTAVTANTTLYAKWTINDYTVAFNSNGGSGVSPESVAYNSTASQPTKPTQTGYTFAGWYSDKGLTTPYSFSTAVTTNTTLYAKWTMNDYTVAFNSNGGSNVSSESVEYNSTASQPTKPTQTGYTFAGWYSDKGLNTPYNFGAAVTGNVALYAKWVLKPLSVTTNLSSALQGAPYAQSLAASGGQGPYIFSVSTGSLPAGLTLSTDGQLTGTPATSGNDSFAIEVTDAKGDTTTKTYSLYVIPAAPTGYLKTTLRSQVVGGGGATMNSHSGKSTVLLIISAGTFTNPLQVDLRTGTLDSQLIPNGWNLIGVFGVNFNSKSDTPKHPISLTLMNPGITPQSKVYKVVDGKLVPVSATVKQGTAVVTFTTDPSFVVLQPQSQVVPNATTPTTGFPAMPWAAGGLFGILTGGLALWWQRRRKPLE